mmetsp:Transcript_24898/g.30593  ORF Transcript_24898/g.30593 Transcript_24898/m.30593 type:complete len:83 (-) Transcript_24898:835-1083(-)
MKNYWMLIKFVTFNYLQTLSDHGRWMKMSNIANKRRRRKLAIVQFIDISEGAMKSIQSCFFFVIVVLETSIGKAVTPMLAPF